MRAGLVWSAEQAPQSSGKTSGQSVASTSLCRDGMNGFRKLHKIGFGTYGSIFLAIHRTDKVGKYYALKKFKDSDRVHGEPGLSRSVIREIRILKELAATGGHENVVEFHGVMVSKSNRGSIYMVLGFCEHDLVGLLELWKRKLTVGEVKSLSVQLLKAVDFCHLHGIVHRDLKCANLLLSKGGVLKLADFGLAREYVASSGEAGPLHMTSKVITLWYRPPELLLGATAYGAEVDLWSAGAIIGELLLQRPLFCSDKESGVMTMIMDEVGYPSSGAMDGFKKNPYWPEFSSLFSSRGSSSGKLETSLSHQCSRAAFELVSGLLCYEPEKRLSAGEAGEHEFFTQVPLPCAPGEIRVPTQGFCHGMGMKQKRDNNHSSEVGSLAKKSRH